MGDALQPQVLALLRDRKGVDDFHLGSVWDGERREHSRIKERTVKASHLNT